MIEAQVLKNLPIEPLEVLAEQAVASWDLPQEEIIAFNEDFPALYTVGCYMHSENLDATQDDEVSTALNVGSDRFTLSMLEWLRSAEAATTNGVPATLVWLGQLHAARFTDTIIDVMDDITTGDNYDPLPQIEDELVDYRTFLAIARAIEASSIESGSDMEEATSQRLGASLAGLAIKRSLEIAEINALNALLAS